MSDRLPDPHLTRIYRLEATLGQALDLGDVASGHRRIVPLTGGAFTGPELSGKLLPGASADWQIVLPDGTALGDIRYTLQTDGGDLLYVQSRGVRHGSAEVLARLGRGEDVDASEYIFRTSTRIDRSPRSRLAQQRHLHQCRRPSCHGRDLRDLSRRMSRRDPSRPDSPVLLRPANAHFVVRHWTVAAPRRLFAVIVCASYSAKVSKVCGR